MASRRHRYNDGKDWAQWHMAAADAFSAEVDGTDRIVKEAFFRLSGPSLDALFATYERHFGKAPADYARAARERWRRGEVDMSALVSRRLYAVMPAFMSADDKRRIVETLWRRYATRSQRYLYVGTGTSVNDVMRPVEEHFEALLSYGNLPQSLKSRFEWLTDRDATEMRRLITNFFEEQKATAFKAVRASLIAMSAAMDAGPIRNPDALSHSVAVGGHVLTLKADPLRVGFLMSDSGTARVKLPSRFGSRGVSTFAALAALICVVVALSSHSNGSSSGAGYYGIRGSGGGGASGGGGTITSGSGSGGYASGGSVSGRETTNDTTGDESGGATMARDQSASRSSPVGDRIARTGGGGPTASSAQVRTGVPAYESSAKARLSTRGNAASAPSPKTMVHALKHVAAVPRIAHATPTPSVVVAAAVDATPGCSRRRIARVGDEGTSVDLDDGEHIGVSDAGLMQTEAATWATGDDATVCAATDRAGAQSISIEVPRHYAKIQGRLLHASTAQPVSCSKTDLQFMDDNGQVLETTDGARYLVSTNGLMRTEASGWSTGDHLNVCTARMHDGDIAAGLENPRHYAIVQASRSGVATRSTVSCKMSRIVAVDNDGETVELAGHETYHISSAGLMRVEAAGWTTGEDVRVCTGGTGSGAAASIENAGHYAKVQATHY